MFGPPQGFGIVLGWFSLKFQAKIQNVELFVIYVCDIKF
jgi:hypothetical protein